MSKEKSEITKKDIEQALDLLGTVNPQIPKLIINGFYKLECNKTNDIEKISRIVEIYLAAKSIKVTNKPKELLIWYLKKGTDTKSRKEIGKLMKPMMYPTTINQHTLTLKRLGLIVYPYTDTKKSKVHPDLVKLRDYVLKKGIKNILVEYI